MKRILAAVVLAGGVAAACTSPAPWPTSAPVHLNYEGPSNASAGEPTTTLTYYRDIQPIGQTDPVFATVNAAYKHARGATARYSHGDTLMLLDGEGRIKGFYGKDDASVARLFADADSIAMG